MLVKKKKRILQIHFLDKQTTETSQIWFLPQAKPSINQMSDSIRRRTLPTPVENVGQSSRTRRTASPGVSDKNRSKPANKVFERSVSDSSVVHRRRDGESTSPRRPSRMMRSLQTEEPDPVGYLPRIHSENFAYSSPSSLSRINEEVRLCFSH